MRASGLSAGLHPTDEIVRFVKASATVLYIGKAAAGSASSAAAWQISRLTSDGAGGGVLEYANGNVLYTNVWNDRASLSYS